MRDFYESAVVNFSGDSLCPLVMKACQQNFERFAVTKDQTATPNPIILAPGGTMNLLPKQLGTNHLDTVTNLACGLNGYETQSINLRNMVVRIFSEQGFPINSTTLPWTSFAGTRLDGYIMQKVETQPRSTHPLLRITKASLAGLKQGFSKLPEVNVPPRVKPLLPMDIGIYTYTTIPFLGPYHFKGEKFNTLDKQNFHRVTIEGKSGLDAFMKWLTFSILASNPNLGEKIWNRSIENGNGKAPWYNFEQIISAIKPTLLSEDLQFHSSNDPYLQLDGYPIDMSKLGLKPGGYATTFVSTSDQSFLAAKAIQPDNLN